MATNVKLSNALRGNKNAAGKRGFGSKAASAAKSGFKAAGAALNRNPRVRAGLIGAGAVAAGAGKIGLLAAATKPKSMVDKARDAKDNAVKSVKRTVKRAVKAVKPG